MFALVGGTHAKIFDENYLKKESIYNSLEKKTFASVVLLDNGCTATIIGPSHILLAAHCVVHESTHRRLKFNLMPGNTIRFHSGYSTHTGGKKNVAWEMGDDYFKSWSHSATIVRTIVHHSYFYASLNGNAPTNAVDLAVIVVKEKIGINDPEEQIFKKGQQPLLPIAKIDFNLKINPNQKIVKVGYGCESLKISGVATDSNWRLKFSSASLPDQETALRKEATYRGSLFKQVYDDFYLVSKGRYFDEEAKENKELASNCPGDSGGPLFTVSENDELYVVGVNSRSRFKKTDTHFESRIDFHTMVLRNALRVDRFVERAQNYDPKEGMSEGVSFFPVIPRSTDFTEDKGIISTTIRDDLYFEREGWFVQVNGIDGNCSVYAASFEGLTTEGKTIKLIAKPNKGVFKSAKPVAFKSVKIQFLKKPDLPRTEKLAPICYANIYALK